MDNTKLVLTFCTALLILSVVMGCIQPSSTSTGGSAAPANTPATMTTAELAEQQMNLAGVQNAEILGEGSTVTVSYNPTDVGNEGQMISDWGTIWGVLSADYPDADTYTIVQLFNGQEVADVSASAADVRSLSSGQISVTDFKNRLVFHGGNSTQS
jgi:hypothetical protein